MAGKTRVPGDIALFNDYVNTTRVYIATGTPTTNGERLGLTSANVDEWVARGADWHDNLYPKYASEDQRTKTVVKQVQNFKTDFKTFANPLLNIMAASPNATEADEVAFNFKIKRKKPTHPTVPLTEHCNGTIIALGGGDLKFMFRTDTDTKRPSLPKGANCIQVAVKIGDPAPKSEYDGTILFIMPRATYVHSVGLANSGQRMYIYQRWYNTKYPELGGPWSALGNVWIL